MTKRKSNKPILVFCNFFRCQLADRNSDLYEFLVFVKVAWKIREFLFVGLIIGSLLGFYLGGTEANHLEYTSALKIGFKHNTGEDPLEMKVYATNQFLHIPANAASILSSFYERSSFSGKYGPLALAETVRNAVDRQTKTRGLTADEILLKLEKQTPYLYFRHFNKITEDDAQLLIRVINQQIKYWKNSFANDQLEMFGQSAKESIKLNKLINKIVGEFVVEPRSLGELNQMSSPKRHLFSLLGGAIGVFLAFIIGALWFFISRAANVYFLSNR